MSRLRRPRQRICVSCGRGFWISPSCKAICCRMRQGAKAFLLPASRRRGMLPWRGFTRRPVKLNPGNLLHTVPCCWRTAVCHCVLPSVHNGYRCFSFDETLKTICMVAFFTSVGFQANVRILKTGGVSLPIFLGCVIVLIIGQNLLAVGLASLLDISPLIGLCIGSISMVGGHGT